MSQGLAKSKPFKKKVSFVEPKELLDIFVEYLEPIVFYITRIFGYERLHKILDISNFENNKFVKISLNHFDFKDYSIKTKKGEISAQTIKEDFAVLYSSLYNEINTHLGSKKAFDLFYKAFIQVKNKYDYDIVVAFLDVMPEDIKSRERLSILSHKELEEQVYERTKELEEEKSKVEKKVEERTFELRMEKNKLETVTENMLDGVILLDANLEPIFVNKQGRDIIGISDNQKDGVLEVFERFFDIDVRKHISTSSVLEKEINNYVFEISFRKIYHEHTKMNEYFLWIKDITQAKLLERAKSEFVSVAAHQLRTPLSGIKWSLDMFIRGDLGKLTTDQKILVKKTYESNERMIILVNDLLNVEHITNKNIEYSIHPAKIFDLINNVLTDLAVDIKRKNLNIKIDHNNIPTIPIDLEKMRLVFQNLLENAVKYTPEKGLITISAKTDEHSVVICISDTGIGIPRSQQPNIFKRFYRASNAKRTNTDGTGLGLFLVRTIIEYHGGRVWFESIEGKGTSFFVSLPI